MYELYLTIKQLLLLPGGPLLLALAGLLSLRRWPRAGRAAAWAGLGLLVMLSMPAVSVLLGLRVEATALSPDEAPPCEAVVVLGGGVVEDAPEYGGPAPGGDTLVRLRYGAWLARRHGLPVLVSGGRPIPSDPAEAPVMARVLAEEFGVRARWIEDRSRNTLENARYAAEMLENAGIDRPCVVTDGGHMGRAMQAFALAGMGRAVAAPTRLPPERELRLEHFIPSPGGLNASNRLIHEWLGRPWQWLRAALDL